MSTAQAELKRESKTEPQTKEDQEQQALSLDDAPLKSEVLQLESMDKKTFDVTKKAAYLSVLVKTTSEGDLEEKKIPLPGVTSAVLTHVVEYLNHHNGTAGVAPEKPLRSNIMKEVCKDAWDAEFINRVCKYDEEKKVVTDKDALYLLIRAANYMDIKCLLSLACARVSAMIKGVPLPEIPAVLRSPMTEAARAEHEKRAKEEQTAEKKEDGSSDEKKR